MLLGMGDINTVAQTIQKVEGYYPGTAAYRNNNPGNLRCCGTGVPCGIQSSAGATGCEAGTNFAVFPSYQAGYNGLLSQIQLDASRGLSISQFINKYAPASDNNNPTSYGAQIANASGLNVNDPLSWAIDMSDLTASIDPIGSTGVTMTPTSDDSISNDDLLKWGGVAVGAALVSMFLLG